MERLTDIEVIAGQVHPIPKLELQNPSGLEKIVSRLQEIEDILGDTYDLGRLRELVEESKKSRARKCPKCGPPTPPQPIGVDDRGKERLKTGLRSYVERITHGKRGRK